MKKKSFLIVLMIFSLLIFASCQSSEPSDNGAYSEEEELANDESPEEATEETSEATLELTLEELSEYDGKDGNRAYVAVEGVIYDVTELDEWQNGMHNGVEAGNDLTDEIMNQSPHGKSTLSQAEVVGKLIE